MNNIRVIISCGGTGGHIFPAIAIADALKQEVSNIEILFVGANGRMEMDKVPTAGYNIKGIDIAGLQRSFSLSNLKLPFKIIKSVSSAKKIIKDFNPNIVIGTGGYASGPTLYAASRLNIPTLIQEQNSYPGITNKLLANKAKAICVAYPDMNKFFPEEKLHLLGNPIREKIENLKINKQEARTFFGLNPDIKTILTIGGSLGARTINQSIDFLLPKLIENNIQLIWQTGKTYEKEAKLALEKNKSSLLYTTTFIKDMDYAYAAADIVISRAGAISLSELCSVGKASILIPSPNVAEDHQTKNAQALASQNAAILIKESYNVKTELEKNILELINNDNKLTELSSNISKLAIKNSAQKIANLALSLIQK